MLLLLLLCHDKSIKSIGNNIYKKITYAKFKQNCKLSTRYTSEDKRVWRYCNNNDCKIKDRFDIVISQTDRRIVSTAVGQVITVIAVKT